MNWRFFVLACSMAVPACVTEPFHNKFIPSRSSPVAVQGWALAPSARVTAQCRPYFTGGSWTDLKTFTASDAALDVGGDDVYAFTGSVTVPNDCWFHWHSQYTTEIRFKAGETLYQMYQEEGRDCVFEKVGEGESAIRAGVDCDPLTSIYMHASGP